MTPLAREIYKHLRRQLRNHVFSMTYGELAAVVGTKHPTHPRSRKLHAALTEVSEACRANGLPCLPALVWRADLARPSDGYYAIAHPRARTEKSRVEAWEREHTAVIAAVERYPVMLAIATTAEAAP